MITIYVVDIFVFVYIFPDCFSNPLGPHGKAQWVFLVIWVCFYTRGFFFSFSSGSTVQVRSADF